MTKRGNSKGREKGSGTYMFIKRVGPVWVTKAPSSLAPPLWIRLREAYVYTVASYSLVLII